MTRRRTLRPAFRTMALALMIMAAFSLHPQALWASQSMEKELPEAVSTSLATLVQRVQDREAVMLVNAIPLLDFAKNTALSRDNWKVEDFMEATGAYFGYSIASPVDRIVKYLYHPELPPSIFHPSVVRVGKWDEGPSEDIPALWQDLHENAVVAVYGQETEENTPDVTTGGYYTYHADRLILLINHGGEKYLLSISKQRDQSSVGRKGVVIGDDADWNYFYTDEEGLTKGGLGWVNSYMFDSFSVTVLSADKSDPERTQHVMFKWVRAGWSGMNMVRSGHVRSGCERFSQSLIKLMESDRLPDIETFQSMTRHVRAMDRRELSRTLQPYIEKLREMSAEDTVLSRRSFQRMLAEDDPLEHYSDYALKSLVMKEFLKKSIGIPAMLTMSHDDVLASLFPEHDQES
ncbi:hypothetical protein SAMN05660653_00933 [Desulfonatronum thiosulfatophilum]|uniref:Uncharacterized protein n=1 Tax=Desulfonatronum thiosulfatophilum TaxID=617002 RepID=A0A1G6BDT3_9BACT|nr:hypothetical protein [Desulfonatronum thiosulfatophilum]SDB18753.1 hypothetical protein SAMN05660653_00933 [Desulfonatronum thiosulfatophilum]